SKFFYDERGSELFEEICALPEYYLTRTETSILHEHAEAIASVVGEDALIIEFGSGSSIKTRILLEHLQSPAAYIPIDISKEFLLESSLKLAEQFPALEVIPVCADYNDTP